MKKTALLVIDVQQSFAKRPYWQLPETAEATRPYFEHQNALIEGAITQSIPVVRVFHSDGPDRVDNPFGVKSGAIVPLAGLVDFEANLTFLKHRHSALVETPLVPWLRQQGIERIIISGIRTEQCCETTARHASDEGWEIDYVLDATLTFPMKLLNGQAFTIVQIRERTAAVLEGRFASVVSVQQALQRASNA